MQDTASDTNMDIDTDPEPAPEATTTATAQRSEMRYPLAHDANGNPIQMPAQAIAWRVRRGGGKRGRPRHVFDTATGRQLELALGASISDLVETNVPPDRYLLYPIDAQGAIIPGVVAVTEVTDSDDDDDHEPERGAVNVDSKDPVLALAAMQLETIKGQQEVIKAQAEFQSKSLGSAVAGYAPVRAYHPPAPPPPIMMEQAVPAAPADTGGMLASLLNMKPDQIIQLVMAAQQMFAMFKGATAGAVVDGGAAMGGGAVGGAL